MHPAASLAFQIAMGVSLAACVGLRTSLPIFLTGLAGRFGWVTLAGHFDWLASWPALVIFGVAVVTEVLADKIPVVDHLLDLLQVLVKPAAGTVLAAAVLTDLSPLHALVLGLVVGAPTASLLHVTKAKLRILSSTTTFGLGNPLLSLFEDGASLVGSIAAFIVPVVVLIVVALGLAALYVFVSRFRRRASRFAQGEWTHPHS